MEIKLVTGATAFEAGVNTIKQIDVTNFSETNLVVVPDAFSMQAESLIFDTLKIKSTFNIEVVGISRLAGKILRGANVSYQRISSLEEVFNIYKATKSCEKEFAYFKTCGVDLCVRILQIIKQFKACKIAPNKIKPVGDEVLDRKMHDLKLIYEHYENLLGEKLDLSNLLEFFLKNAEKTLDLSKINLFFVNFDSFTLEINNFICRLAGLVNRVCIGMARSLSPKNAYIYEDDIFRKTTALAKEYGISVQVEAFPTALEGERLDIVKNLFSIDVEKKKNEQYFLNVLAKNMKDEVEFVAKYIKNAVVNGKSYKNFSVAVADKKYFDCIKDVFAIYGITANTDDAVDLSQTVLGRFVLRVLEMAKLGLGRKDFEYFASNPLFGVDEKVLSEISYFCVDDEKEFLQRFPQYQKAVGLVETLSCGKKIEDFSLVLQDFIDLVKENYVALLDKLDKEKFFKKQSENLQAVELLTNVLDKLCQLGGDEKISIFDFENILLLSLKSVKVETIPSYIDAVFVGDATDSYFEDVDTLFVLGATAGSLPRTQNDTGLIDDDDIRKLRLNFALEPEIKVLNRRNRLKLFELLQHGKKNLIVTVPMSQDGRQSEKAEFVEELLTLFGRNVTHTSAYEDFDLGLFSAEENLERLLFYVGCKENLLSAYSNLKSKQKLPKAFESSLFSVLNDAIPSENKTKTVSEKFLLPRNMISASKLECYFSCPFKYLLQYGLKLSPKENIQPNKKTFGTFEHALLKEFVESFEGEVGNVTEAQLQQFLSENVERLARPLYDEKNFENQNFLDFLIKESKIILKNVIKEQKNSNFRPKLLEEKVVFPLFDDVNLEGYVDRVDVCGDYFRIIDYKTGNTENVKSALFYGKKLQLFLYGEAIKQKTALSCGGVYYFDCRTKYEKHGETPKLFNGLTLKDNQVVEWTDFKLADGEKSEIIGMEMVSKPKEGKFIYKYGSTEENFEKDFEYAVKISSLAISEMKSGYAEPKPFKGACEYCPYISICRHVETDGGRKMFETKKKKGEK